MHQHFTSVCGRSHSLSDGRCVYFGSVCGCLLQVPETGRFGSRALCTWMVLRTLHSIAICLMPLVAMPSS